MFFNLKLTFFFLLSSTLFLLSLVDAFQAVDFEPPGLSRGAFIAHLFEITKTIQRASKVRFPFSVIRHVPRRFVLSGVNSPLAKYFSIVYIPCAMRSVYPGYSEQSAFSINPLHSFDIPGVQFIDQPVPKPQSLLSQTFTVVIHGASLPLRFVESQPGNWKMRSLKLIKSWYSENHFDDMPLQIQPEVSYSLSLKTELVFAYRRALNRTQDPLLALGAVQHTGRLLWGCTRFPRIFISISTHLLIMVLGKSPFIIIKRGFSLLCLPLNYVQWSKIFVSLRIFAIFFFALHSPFNKNFFFKISENTDIFRLQVQLFMWVILHALCINY